MDAALLPIAGSLAELTEIEFRALIAATDGMPQTAPGLLAWLEAACDWELNRRAGFDYELQALDAAIPPEEDAISIDAVVAMRSTLARDTREEASGVLALFDALVELLTGGRQKH